MSAWLQSFSREWARKHRDRAKWFMKMARFNAIDQDARAIFVREARHHWHLMLREQKELMQ